MEANIAARRARHKKVFAGIGTLTRLNVFNGLKSFSLNTGAITGVLKKKSHNQSNVNPSNKLFRTYSMAVAGIFVIGVFNPTSANTLNSVYTPTLEGVEDYYFSDNILLSSQDGYIPKINPQTELGDRTGVNGKVVHEVRPGETLSEIANDYGVSTNTVLWENGLSASSTIKPGDKIFVPPVDGVGYNVEKGDSIEKIAEKFGVETEAISKQNGLEGETTLVAGQSLFIPGAKPLPAPVIRTTPSYVASSNRVVASAPSVASSASIGSNSTAAPAVGKSMIWPTRGKVTQGYRAGHYAIDIADVSKPPIWAANSGTIIKVSTGTWGGGYGNHVIIDHGNGLQTLYAHMETVAVSNGQQVGQGDVIGKMGRTGRVYGRTGIHLHFEVRKNGIKQNPANYF
ncbi:peptidoglycan DD-metalloendopeptidase family protein [Candidatus Peregrinibacteria bacterium]|nr:peptidoglycan DD-metalloendopeptidase family protein [Candidatus Peregrinibacteria bacterium]